MVDGAATLRIDAHAKAAPRAAPSIEVRAFDAAAYAFACAGLVAAPPQTPAWAAAFAAHRPDVMTVMVRRDGRIELAMALDIAPQGAFTVGRFLGGSHANGNFGAVAAQLAPDALGGLSDAVGKARPDIDALLLERQAKSLDGIANPFLALPHAPSPNIALAVDLSGGFDGVLSRASGKRKKKKHRSQTRKFEAAGGFRTIRASTPAEVERVLDAFFAMKRVRFQKMGIADVFADPAIQASFRTLFTDALAEARPRFVLDALEVGGTLRAITGCSLAGGRIVCEFGAIAEDDLAPASPGDFLFFENIRAACAQGLAVYDFSVGDEHYKRLWCDIEQTQFDVFVPLSAKGRLLVAGRRAGAGLTRAIKGNPFLWSLVKRLRRQTVQAAPASADED